MEMEKKKRSTDNELILSQGTKDLLDLFYRLESSKKNKKVSGELDDYIIDFLRAIWGPDCKFEHDEGRLRVSVKEMKGISIRFIDISQSQIKNFQTIMEKLALEIRENKFNHISLSCVEDNILSAIELEKDWRNRISRKGKGNINNDTEEKPYRPFPDELRKSLPVVDKTLVKLVQSDGYLNQQPEKDYVVNTRRERIFHVRPMTDFGNLLLINGMSHQDLKRIIRDPDPDLKKPLSQSELFKSKELSVLVHRYNSLTLSNFIEIARSVLVHFHLSFNGFERIKVCEFCQKKLLFVKRTGKKKFCSASCRVRSRNSKMDKKKEACWHRHYGYFLNRRKKEQLQMYSISKDKCKECLEIKKSGACNHWDDQFKINGIEKIKDRYERRG